MRLDHRLIQLGLAPSRQKAKDYIESGHVKIGAEFAKRPGQRVTEDDEIHLINPDKWVSRGAYKLDFAISAFKLELHDKVCLDIGASTGGFTQVCLTAGAKKVYAVDVGTAQLHPTLKEDSRVISLEQTHVNQLSLQQKVGFICVDVSFISVTQILPSAASFLLNNADAVILIKPQYEVGKENLPANGIVLNQVLHEQAIKKVKTCAQASGFTIQNITTSPIKGKAGNTEYLLHLRSA